MASRPTIYILDDDESVRRSLTRLMRSAGYQVAAFGGVEEFLSTNEFLSGSCVVTDLRMPGANGLSLPAKLRQRKSDLPVIGLTADDSEALRGEARAAGIASLFRKPVDDQALIDAIEWAVGHAEPTHP